MKIGILGGGQLGMMMTEESAHLSISVQQLDPNPAAPCSRFEGFHVGDVTEPDAVFAFGKDLDIVTYEWERVSLAGLKKLEAAGVTVFPRSKVLEIIQDKGTQKQFLDSISVPNAPYSLWEPGKELPSNTPFPCIQKARLGGYDGQGVQVVKDRNDLWQTPSVMEVKVKIEKEIAVQIARSSNGESVIYDAVEMVFDPVGNLVTQLIAPANISSETHKKAQKMTQKIAEKLDYIGLLAVEFFIDTQGSLIVNGLAPRPHNSGHHTIEACKTSQFENHMRAVLGRSLGSPALLFAAGGMINLLGQSTGKAALSGTEHIEEKANAHLHWYGKTTAKPLRKMGHITVTGNDMTEVQKTLAVLQEKVRVITS